MTAKILLYYFCIELFDAAADVNNKTNWIIKITLERKHNLKIHIEPSLFFLAALQALKRKKRFEQQLIQIDGTLSTIEFQREALENATTNTEVMKNLGYAAKAIKGVHQTM